MKSIQTDVLVVGSGIAGTLFALELAKTRPDLKLLLISSTQKKESASFLAQGGIAAVLPGSSDTINKHVHDTLEAGAYTNNPAIVTHFISQAALAIKTLEEWNIKFDTNIKGDYNLALEGGHHFARILHQKDSTGKHIMERLFSQLKNFSNIHIIENLEVFKLLKTNNDSLSGAYAWCRQKQKSITIKAKQIILCTGGLGSLFHYSTNPASAKGQGVALAQNVGAYCESLQNIQFHPTALWSTKNKRLKLISEALRGAGAFLRNEAGEKFMSDRHPLKDLAPRDVVSRAIIQELKLQENPYVYLDATSINPEDWRTHFPGILNSCLEEGINPAKDWIPVVPAAHYSCGGIKTDVNGFTNISGLFILGETASTGLHGANRLASNSLLEAVLMAKGLSQKLRLIPKHINKAPEIILCEFFSDQESIKKSELYNQKIRDILQENCHIIKTIRGLNIAHKSLIEIKEKVDLEFHAQNIEGIRLKLFMNVALILVESSLETKENKGVFYNEDFTKSITVISKYFPAL